MRAGVLLTFSAALMLISPAALEAQTLRRVPTDYATIQAAIVAALHGDTVLVSPGTYVERIDFLGKAITVKSESGANVTFLDGSGADGSIVTLGPGESALSILQGFTIRNGTESIGAALHIHNTNPVIQNNIFELNSVSGGAAVWISNAAPLVANNRFRQNVCDDQFISATLTIVNISAPEVTNNIFEANQCRAIAVLVPEGSTPLVANNTIVGNHVGIRVAGPASADSQRFLNNLIFGNAIGHEFDAAPDDEPATWLNNLVFGNSTNYSGVADQTGINGNLSADPLFVAAGDFRLSSLSPAIDAGIEPNASRDDTDFFGGPRMRDGNGDGTPQFDIGADEFDGPLPATVQGLRIKPGQ
jgi:hypothetical protein